MVFNSLDSALAYIKGAVADSMQDIAEKSKQTMEEVAHEQIVGISGDMFNSPQIASVGATDCVLEWSDNGGWTSLVGKTKGQHFFAFYGLEYGHTWGRGATSLMDTSLERITAETPPLLIRTLLSRGITCG